MSGRSDKDKDIWRHVHALANFRKNSSALTLGKMMQYFPNDGLYVYFRYDEKQTIMVAMNTAKKSKTVSFKNYTERLMGFNGATDVVTKKASDLKDFELGSYQAVVLELTK
jgi:glycosidase